jgi:DNA recombination protein RmuC
MDILLIVLCALVVVAIVLIILFRPRPNNNLFALSSKLDELFSRLDKITDNLKEDFRTNREEISRVSRDNREELSRTLLNFKTEMNETLRLITEQNRVGADTINKTLEERISALVQKVESGHKESREAISTDWKEFSLVQRNKFDEWKMLQKEGIKNN